MLGVVVAGITVERLRAADSSAHAYDRYLTWYKDLKVPQTSRISEIGRRKAEMMVRGSGFVPRADIIEHSLSGGGLTFDGLFAETYTVRMVPAPKALPALRVQDHEGEQVAYREETDRITFTAPSDGEYHVVASPPLSRTLIEQTVDVTSDKSPRRPKKGHSE